MRERRARGGGSDLDGDFEDDEDDDDPLELRVVDVLHVAGEHVEELVQEVQPAGTSRDSYNMPAVGCG